MRYKIDPLLGHAVSTSQVATVSDGETQVIDDAITLVNKLFFSHNYFKPKLKYLSSYKITSRFY